MTNIDWLAEAQALIGEISALRETLHQNPELGNQEYRTADVIEQTLRRCGVRTERLLDTAVVGTLTCRAPGPCVALRADMDALAVQEKSGAACTSRIPGRMHACGHDVHMAAALGAAMLLAKRRDTLPGTVKFFFQPDEEGDGGAQRMIEAGCMADVDAVFGAHVTPELPVGTAGVRYGKFYAASDTFCIRVYGKSCHGATPEKGVDALAAAAELALALRALPAQLTEPCVLSVCTLRAGTAINVLAGEAEMTGIVRTLGSDSRNLMHRHMRRLLEQTARRTGVEAQLQLHESYPGVVNDPAQTARVQSVAARVLGAGAVQVLQRPTMTTEDFGYFLGKAPGSFYHIGAGCREPLHSPAFFPDVGAAVTAAALHAAVAADFLGRPTAQQKGAEA